jgi:hypothetical protein
VFPAGLLQFSSIVRMPRGDYDRSSITRASEYCVAARNQRVNHPAIMHIFRKFRREARPRAPNTKNAGMPENAMNYDGPTDKIGTPEQIAGEIGRLLTPPAIQP